jgi:hypothetical protein
MAAMPRVEPTSCVSSPEQSNDDKNVEAAPGQSVEPERDIGVNNAGGRFSPHSTSSKKPQNLARPLGPRTTLMK